MSPRIEKDFLGEREVPDHAYYGIQTVRAMENFPITGVPVHRELVAALAEVKKAAARANGQVGMLPNPIMNAIVQAADEIIAGKWFSQFVVDSIQGGAGTSINMNMNEVIANRALELLGHAKGEYFYCSPNNHVNMSQSTNDTLPTAMRISAYRLTASLLVTMTRLIDGLREKARAFDAIVKVGRTHLQDAVPIRLGQEFGAYARVLDRDRRRISDAAKGLLDMNLGATAVGTGLNAKPAYIEAVAEALREQLGFPFRTADDLVDATQNTDAFTSLSAALKVCAVNISKICNDLRLMASGPRAGFAEIRLPPRQPGSSIMPGKINPVMAEVMNQIAFQVKGNDYTVCSAAEAGQLELNVMGPVLAFNLLQSLKVLRNGMDVFLRFGIEGLEASADQCEEVLHNSYSIITTALNPHLGYETAAQLIKEALATNRTIKEVALERQLLTPEELDEILQAHEMTTPGIAGSRFLLTH